MQQQCTTAKMRPNLRSQLPQLVLPVASNRETDSHGKTADKKERRVVILGVIERIDLIPSLMFASQLAEDGSKQKRAASGQTFSFEHLRKNSVMRSYSCSRS